MAGGELNRVESIFAEAVELTGQAREEYLAKAGAGEAEAVAQVRVLLAAHEAAGSAGFLGSPTAVAQERAEGQRTPRGSTVATWGDKGGAGERLLEGPGSRIGPYKLLEQIGEGGFGVVFMAEQERPVIRRVALKIIKLGMDTRQVIARFEAERQALAVMDHPNIAKVLDAGATDTGRPYFVMELVKGEPITSYCDRHNLEIPERLNLFLQVCRAVQHAHQKGVIHRDIKPTNILVAAHDGHAHAKVIDFGIAKATEGRLNAKTYFTEFHQLIGTPEYMSPEQAQGLLDIDTRSDVYSLGVLLYELITGTTPFDSRNLRLAAFGEIQRIIREVDPPKPSTRLSTMGDSLPSVAAHRHTDPRRLRSTVHGELDWIVMKALDKERGRRYETASAFATDIQHYLDQEPVVAGPPGRLYRLGKLVRRNRATFAGAAGIVLALIAGLAIASYGMVQARRERDQKQEALQSEARQRQVAQENAQTADEQRKLAQRAAARSGAIQDFFLRRMLGSIDPDVSGGESLTVREVMDRAAESAGQTQDPEVEASLRQQIGAIYHSLGLHKEARPQLERSIAIRQGLAGQDLRAQTAETMLTLAHVLRLLEEPGRGEDLVRAARAARVQLFGEESLPVVEADYHLAETLYRLGKDHDAAEINRRSLEVMDRLAPAGREPALQAQILAAYARYLSRAGKKAEAADLLERAVEIHRRVDGSSSTRLATALSLLGGILADTGRMDEAERRTEEALEIRRRLLPASHPMVAQSVQTLGLVKMRAGHPADAEPLVRESLDIYTRAYGPRHEFVASSNVTLGAVLAAEGKYEDAARAYADAIDVFAALFGADDGRLANARSGRGACLTKLARYDEAEQLLLEAHRSLAKTGLNRAALVKTTERLVDLYTAWGKPDKAKEWKARLEGLGPGKT
jgi:serine/threonine protein kinase